MATKHFLVNIRMERGRKVVVECEEGQGKERANSSVFLELKTFLGSKAEKILSTAMKNIYLIQ